MRVQLFLSGRQVGRELRTTSAVMLGSLDMRAVSFGGLEAKKKNINLCVWEMTVWEKHPTEDVQEGEVHMRETTRQGQRL